MNCPNIMKPAIRLETSLVAAQHLLTQAPPLLDANLVLECVAYADGPKSFKPAAIAEHLGADVDSCLILAADKRCFATTRLLAVSAPIAVVDRAAVVAAMHGHIKMMLYLVESFNRDRASSKALMCSIAREATVHGRVDVAKYVIDNGSGMALLKYIGKNMTYHNNLGAMLWYAVERDLDMQASHALHIAARIGDLDLFIEMRRRGAHMFDGCLCQAIKFGHACIVQYLIDEGLAKVEKSAIEATLRRESDEATDWILENWHDQMADSIRAVLGDMQAFKRCVADSAGRLNESEFRQLFGAVCNSIRGRPHLLPIMLAGAQLGATRGDCILAAGWASNFADVQNALNAIYPSRR